MAYTAERLVRDLEGKWGRNLLSAAVYGSAAGEGFDPRWSDVNLLLVVRDMDRAGGADTRKAFRKWTAAGNPLPLVMDPDFIRRSADVFPIEWMDMKEKHRVILGRDPLKALKVGRKNLRLELERELKGNLLRLQGKYRLIAGKRAQARELMVLSWSTFQNLFRAFLRLKGTGPLPPKGSAAEALAKRLGLGTAVPSFLANLREGEGAARRADPARWIERYFGFIREVVRKAETL
jgi:hypothetical protein